MAYVKSSHFLTSEDIESIYKKDHTGNIIQPCYYDTNSQVRLQQKISATRNDPIIIKSIPGQSGVINAEKFDRIYANSDIHSDYRNFINYLKNLNLISIPDNLHIYTDINNLDTRNDIYDTRFITETQWLAHNTLYIIVGDLVDGRRVNLSVDDPRGTFDILIHMFIYNLRLKALKMNSDILFTIGNHDIITAINHDSLSKLDNNEENWSNYGKEMTLDMKLFFKGSDPNDGNICENKRAMYDRHNCLTMFYSLSPYLFIEIINPGGNTLNFIHSSLILTLPTRSNPKPGNKLPDLRKYQKYIEELAVNNHFKLSKMQNEPDGYVQCNTLASIFNIISSRDYTENYKYDHALLCSTYSGYLPNYTLIVGHTYTMHDFIGKNDSHYLRNITRNKIGIDDEYYGCDQKNDFGCIIPKCFTNNFKLIMVDTGFSRPFGKRLVDNFSPFALPETFRDLESSTGLDGSNKVTEILKIKRTRTKFDYNIKLPYFGLFYRVRWNPYKHIQISDISVLPDVSNAAFPKTSGIADDQHRRSEWVNINEDSEKKSQRDINEYVNPNSALNSSRYGGYTSSMYKQKYLKYKQKYIELKLQQQ
jgi:hypothetical protein